MMETKGSRTYRLGAVDLRKAKLNGVQNYMKVA